MTLQYRKQTDVFRFHTTIHWNDDIKHFREHSVLLELWLCCLTKVNNSLTCYVLYIVAWSLPSQYGRSRVLRFFTHTKTLRTTTECGGQNSRGSAKTIWWMFTTVVHWLLVCRPTDIRCKVPVGYITVRTPYMTCVLGPDYGWDISSTGCLASYTASLEPRILPVWLHTIRILNPGVRHIGNGWCHNWNSHVCCTVICMSKQVSFFTCTACRKLTQNASKCTNIVNLWQQLEGQGLSLDHDTEFGLRGCMWVIRTG